MSRSNFYKKQSAKPKERYVPWHELQPLTEALLQFCLEHKYPEDSLEIESIKNCIEALKEKSIGRARSHYARIHFGKEGFNEWPPRVVYQHESPEYVSAVFKSLCFNWRQVITHVITT